jgi:hypothetical protein
MINEPYMRGGKTHTFLKDVNKCQLFPLKVEEPREVLLLLAKQLLSVVHETKECYFVQPKKVKENSEFEISTKVRRSLEELKTLLEKIC